MKEKHVCRTCEHCRKRWRNRATVYGSGRRNYFCEHPELDQLPLSAFGNSTPGFIGFGTNTWESPLAMRTSPRWCPLKKQEKG